MKITFQGTCFNDILNQMAEVLDAARRQASMVEVPPPAASSIPEDLVFANPQGPGPEPFAETAPPVDKPVAKSVDKPGKTRTPKQLENDAKLRERALAKKAAGLKPFDKMPKAAPPVEKPMPPPPASAESLGLAPDEVVKLRQKTIADLQDAYANGHQKEVFELLSRFGNGAKSFRELPPDAFVPISEAIANGALT